MNSNNRESLYDYLARLNIEGKRTIWAKNRAKINFIYLKTRKYFNSAVNVCEVGIGEGYLLRLLHRDGFKVTGVDISRYLVNELKKKFDTERLNIELIHGDISKLKLQRNKFDVIFCLDVLEHIPNVNKAIQNIKEGLRDGGLLIGTLPLYENLYDNMVICPRCKWMFHRLGHCHAFNSIEDIKQLLGRDFEILEIGEVNIYYKKSDIISYIIQKIFKTIFRKRIYTTVYFVARINKS